MKLLFSVCVLALAITTATSSALAQKETETGVEPVKDISLLRRDLRGDKKQLVAMNVPLTEAEAAKFWPVYDRYVAEMTKLHDVFYAVVKEYAEKQKVISDADSMALMKRWGQVLVEIAQLRQQYIPIFEKIIPAKKAAVFVQVDRRLYALMDLQVVSATPLLGGP